MTSPQDFSPGPIETDRSATIVTTDVSVALTRFNTNVIFDGACEKRGGEIMIHPRANRLISASGEAALRIHVA